MIERVQIGEDEICRPKGALNKIRANVRSSVTNYIVANHTRQISLASSACSACGVDSNTCLPLEDGTWTPAVTPRVTKAMTKGANRTILFECCLLIVNLGKYCLSGDQKTLKQADGNRRERQNVKRLAALRQI